MQETDAGAHITDTGCETADAHIINRVLAVFVPAQEYIVSYSPITDNLVLKLIFGSVELIVGRRQK